MFKKLFLFIFSLLLLSICFYAYIASNKQKDNYFHYISSDKLVNANLPKSFENCDKNGFCYSEDDNITTYIVNYKKTEFKNNPKNVVKSYIDTAKNNYKFFKDLKKTNIIELNNKVVYSDLYLTVIDDFNYNFHVSAIDYKNSDIYTLVVFVLTESNYKNNVKLINEFNESFYPYKKSN